MAAREKIKLTSYDELLGVTNDGTEEIEIARLTTFKNHPFKVIEDERMDSLVESIKENGVLSPILVRKTDDGNYEIISGHRRKRACELAGINKIPAIIKELDDDEAVILMVDSNIQREEILPSEKAYAYKMKMDAMNHRGSGKKNEGKSAEVIAESEGIGSRQVYRYMRLTNLIPELLELVDEKKLAMVMAIDISYMNKEFQRAIYESIEKGRQPKKDDIAFMKRNKETLTVKDIEDLMSPEQETVKKAINVTIKQNKLQEYFPPGYSREDMEKVIYSLLDKWKEGKD